MDGLDLLSLGFVLAALRSATPLLWALLGETVSQRAGIINLGSEGQMLIGAATAFALTAATGAPWLGLCGGAAAGLALSSLHALLCIRYRAHPFASGLAVWMVGFGLSSYVGAPFIGQSIAGFDPLPLVPELTPSGLMALVAAPLIGAAVFLTRPGLALRAVGESASAARAAGVRVGRLRTVAVLAGGALCGVGGAALSIELAQTWAEGMTQGRGLIAVGLVIVARWNPFYALPAALLFGAAETLSLRAPTSGAAVSAQLLHTLPYLISLAVFVLSCARDPEAGHAPGELRAVVER